MKSFDEWRAAYDSMTFAEHQAFNADCVQAFPEQRCWNEQACREFLAERRPRTVVELGGWDGGLAAAMLAAFPFIETWTNYDISPGVPQECTDPRYSVVVLNDWPWRMEVTADALVASHVFEHMRMGEVVWLLDRWNVTSVYADVPISQPWDWRGYNGSHIIEAGRDEFLDRVRETGFRPSTVIRDNGLIAYLDRVPVCA